MVDNVLSLDRGEDYADKVDLPEVWSQLGKAQLNGLRVSDAIESYKKANDPSNFKEVIEIASHAGKDDELISYLTMARKTLREPEIDGQLLLSYAATDKLYDLKDFLNSPNVADLETIGDKLYNEKQYEAAKVVFTSISNWAKLASTLVF